MILHYDLFAGIGGFSLALEEVFKGEAIKHIFCEWEAFPTAVLKQHWPDGEYWGDIADLVAHTKGKRFQGDNKKQESTRRSGNSRHLTIITGGFPCQPFSHAGRRRGTEDHRYQWPNMFEVIRNVKPQWVIAENVRGLVTWSKGMVLEQVCADLESEGYDVQPLVIPAVAVNAPHRRDRVWIVAHRRSEEPGGLSQQPRPTSAKDRPHSYPDWSRDWREVASATCIHGLDDGIPRRMDGSTISAARHRQEALKAYGNAIVPQVAMQLFTSIREASWQKV